MCGIGGASLVPGSKVNMRALGAALLSELTYRGYMASGYAYVDGEGQVQSYREPTRGNQLKMKGLPRNAKTAIFHTRYATKGKVEDNRNNHPIMSPDNNIALVHNGVISNDGMVRRTFDEETQKNMPPVDTAVIPALLQFGGYKRFDELSGDATVAWLDNATGETLHLAKISHSPVSATYLEDGSMVFASTEKLLRAALGRVGLKHGFIGTLDDGEYVQIKGGHVEAVLEIPESQYQINYYDASQWRNATSGGHGTSTGTSMSYPKYESPRKALTVYGTGTEYDGTDSVKEETGALGFGNGTSVWDDEGWDPYGSVADGEEARFYSVDYDGDYKEYATLDALTNDLIWYASLRVGEDKFGASDEARWVEWFLDVGEIINDDFPREAISWVEEPEASKDFEVDNELAFIREGASHLGRMVGA